jgi:hypothetical protein
MDGLNFSPRNMQQLLNNAFKDATNVTLTTIGGDMVPVRTPIELGTECISFKIEGGVCVVPYHAIQRIVVS